MCVCEVGGSDSAPVANALHVHVHVAVDATVAESLYTSVSSVSFRASTPSPRAANTFVRLVKVAVWCLGIRDGKEGAG